MSKVVNSIILYIILILMVSCSKDAKVEDNQTTEGKDPYLTEQIYRIEPEVLSPKFTLENLNGESKSLEDYKGKVLFINFWASWCGPCVHEMPSIASLNDYYKNDNEVEILLINLGEDKATVESFMEKEGYNIETLLDTGNKVGGLFGIRSIPTTIIINKKGFIVGTKTGAHQWDREGVKNILDSLK